MTLQNIISTIIFLVAVINAQENRIFWDGREWRIHYWRFKPELREKVLSYMDSTKEEVEIDPFSDIYGEIGEMVWNRDDDMPSNPNAFTNDRW